MSEHQAAQTECFISANAIVNTKAHVSRSSFRHSSARATGLFILYGGLHFVVGSRHLWPMVI